MSVVLISSLYCPDFTIAGLRAWLKKYDLGQYEDAFQDHGFDEDLNTFRYMTIADLATVIPKIGHQAKFRGGLYKTFGENMIIHMQLVQKTPSQKPP